MLAVISLCYQLGLVTTAFMHVYIITAKTSSLLQVEFYCLFVDICVCQY